ncbi:DUF423 domain-containing protein [Sphingobacterium daejeonense]|uniref:DUF423 domain-containing protein n=1 Tax=Sphingobacterium daejeonense TaxID=371142 RepID=A0ABW3RPA9_9SPHI|nr:MULTISPECIES: DUF423 domain-containing protein [Sphingobacterium]MCT1532507.1 DUF423 domain-containing protein [Sphingobacterium daejeonense]VTP96745.1 Protein of uncharacterised function (DUF423) [Sphingobacterium daejeonense]
MNQIALISGSILGILSIVFGAFGAHALKKVLTEERLNSFEVGVRYQMYAAITLLIIGFHLDFATTTEKWAYYGIFWGCILFSGSIYFLSLKDVLKANLRFLGPITPLGGLLMIVGWVMLLISFL